MPRNHVSLAPLCYADTLRRNAWQRIESSWGQHNGDQPPMLHDIDTTECGDIVEQSAKVILGVRR